MLNKNHICPVCGFVGLDERRTMLMDVRASIFAHHAEQSLGTMTVARLIKNCVVVGSTTECGGGAKLWRRRQDGILCSS
jgi:hypothetical protein